jgi:class 3 adenylate cyclase
MFDKRGMGLSDRLRSTPTLESRMDDIRAVMEDAGVERAAVMAAHEATRIGVMFAASYPERVQGLVLHEPSVRGRQAPGYPWARSDEEWRAWLGEVAADWGSTTFLGRQLHAYSPTVAEDPEFVAWYVRHMRSSASPSAAAAYQRMVMDGDVSDLLPAIRVPTLVTHRPMSLEVAEHVTRHIPGAVRREIPGLVDGYSWADPAANQVLLDEVERFVRGLGEPAEPDVFLGTFLFTDIASSTEKAAELGDIAWRRLLDQHHAVVRHQLARHGGIEAGTAGDGFFATFDGPGRAIRCACAIRDAVRNLGLEVRAGLHTGEGERHRGEISGIAIHIAARVAGEAKPGEVLVSSTVRDLVAGSQLEFVDRGTHTLKGVPGEWRLFTTCPAPRA